MKNQFKRISAMVLAVLMCVSVIAVGANAIIIRASHYLDSVYANVGTSSNGKIDVGVSIEATGTMSKVGATEIKIQESKNNGSTYSTVKTYSYLDYPDMMHYNVNHYDEAPVTYQGTIGYRYRAIVTCYAGNSSGSDSHIYTSGSIVAAR